MSILKMRAVARSFSFIFLACVLTNEVRTAMPREARTNTYVADNLGKIFQAEVPILIAGSPNGFYGVWGCIITYRPGMTFTVQLTQIYVYVLEVPATKHTKYAQYALTISTRCPVVFELKSTSKGDVQDLDLPWATIYEVIRKNRNYTQSTPCNLIDAYSTFVDPTISMPGQEIIQLLMNAITSYQYTYITGNNKTQRAGDMSRPDSKGVEEVYPDTYVNRKFYDYNTVNNSCKVPTYNGIGAMLAYRRYDFKNWLKPGGFCRLATTAALLRSYMPVATPSFSILSYVYPPYDKFYRLAGLVSTRVVDDTYISLDQVCARLADCS